MTVYSGKVDLGTGVRTALAQIVAEELDVPFSRVTIVQGDTALTPDQGPTFGSLSIQIGGVQIRNAAAMAKSALLDLAVTRLGVTVPELTVADGVISGGGKQVSYGELIAGKAFSLTLDHQKPPATKDAKAFKIVGTSVPRLDIPDKVTGKFTYVHDFRVPGMLHGRVVRPPAIGAFAVTSSLATLVARTWSKTLACSGNPSHADHVALSCCTALIAAHSFSATMPRKLPCPTIFTAPGMPRMEASSTLWSCGILDVGFAWLWVCGEESGRLHDHAVDAIAALRRLFLDKGALQRMQIFLGAQSFQRHDLVVFADRGQGSYA